MLYVSGRHHEFLLDYLRTLDIRGAESRYGFEGRGLEVVEAYWPIVEQYLDAGIGNIMYDDENIIEELKLLLDDSKMWGHRGQGSRVKALELLGKYKGMWTGKGDETGRSDAHLMPYVELDGVEHIVKLEKTKTNRLMSDGEVLDMPYRVIGGPDDDGEDT